MIQLGGWVVVWLCVCGECSICLVVVVVVVDIFAGMTHPMSSLL